MGLYIGMEGSSHMIDNTYRVNVLSSAAMVNGLRPILVKCSSVDTKIQVLKASRKLIGLGIYVNEDLFQYIQAMFSRA